MRITLVTVISTILSAQLSSAQQQGQDGSDDTRALSPAAAMRELLGILQREGRDAREEGEMPRAYPNIAADFPHEIAMDVLARKIITQLDRDPFIDMYMRWQLTSFSPALPDLSDREFERMLDQLSGYVPNPRADERFISQVSRGIEAGELSEKDQALFEERFNTLARDSSRARALNQPAEQFRKWLSEQVGDESMRAIQLQLDHCLARTRSGWPVNAEKARLEELLAASARDRTFDDSHRRRIITQIRRLREDTRNYVASARVEQGRLEVNFTLTGIYDFDISRWLRTLERG